MKDFEEGKFYKLQITPAYGSAVPKFIPALCTHVLKRQIEFQYGCKTLSGELRKLKIKRSLQKATEHCHAQAYSNERFSMISPTTADMEATKPSWWDTVSEEA